MTILVRKRRVALLAAGVVAATGAALAPSYAAGTVTIDRTGNTDYGWFHTDCSAGGDLPGDLPQPVAGPHGVPHGAGSLAVTAPDDTYTEYDIPGVRSIRDVTTYELDVLSPDGEAHLVASIRPQTGGVTWIVAIVPVQAGGWSTLDLRTITWEHTQHNRGVFWDDPVDDTGTLAHFVDLAAPDPTTRVQVLPALAILGCDGNGGVGAHTLYLDQSTIATTDDTEVNAGTIDHEPSTAPTPVVSKSKNVTITYGRRTTLSTTMTYGDDWPLVEQPWAFETATPGSSEWDVTAMDVTGSDGTARRTVKPSVNTSYRWLHPEDSLGYFLDAVSGRTEVLVRSKVVAQVVDSTVPQGSTVKLRGAVGPRPPRGTSVTLWRWGTHHVRLEQASVDKHGAFTVATRAAKAGTLPLRVTIDATDTNAAGRSRVMKVHVTR